MLAVQSWLWQRGEAAWLHATRGKFSRHGNCRSQDPISADLNSRLDSHHVLPMEPQPLSSKARKQWFEGWFVRTIDQATGVSVAAIFGSLRLGMEVRQDSRSSELFDEHILVLAWGDATGRQFSSSLLLPGGAVTLQGGELARGARPRVRWWSTEHGGIEVAGDVAWLDLRLAGGLRLRANVSAPRVLWDRARPDHGGPEGWLGPTGLLPCHYFVHTFASPTTYQLARGSVRLLGGEGVSHIERNYGETFPTAWVWAQACTVDSAMCIVLTGGLFVVGPLVTRTHILALRGRAAGGTRSVDWTFRSTDGDRFSVVRSPCDGRLQLNASSLNGRRAVSLLLSAPARTFGSRLPVPTNGGFSDQPGCRESYHATATMLVREWTGSPLGRWDRSAREPRTAVHAQGQAQAACQDEKEMLFPNAALEFGGAWQC